jgi:unsaturated chondroitin disaccharide hydrolase
MRLISFLLLVSFSAFAQQPKVKKAVAHAAYQSNLMLAELAKADDEDRALVSPRTLVDGKLKLVASRDWTSGFFAGNLWYLFELSKNEKWKMAAEKYTANIEQEKDNGKTHDMGFKIYCSFGNGYRLTNNAQYKEVILQSAKTLATRFNPKVGAIRSWDHNADKWDFPVIIDNMLNLELLFAATKLSGDSSYYKIAVRHANTTLKNHFRSDFGTWHVISYHPETGEVMKKNTHQGYTDGSTWARGEAWALYGYTMCYRETKNPVYLQQAKDVANFIFTHKNMPSDLVPYWDFDAPRIPDEPRDVSATSVMASALYELSTLTEDQDYFSKANKMMQAIALKYASEKGAKSGFILDHSTGSKPSDSEVDVPLVYADYYYLEALTRYQKIKNK